MLDVFKKAFLAGVGMTAMTKDRVEALARDMVSAADMSADKGEEFINEAVARAESARTDLEDTIAKMVNERLAKTNVATREDIAQLAARIDALEAKLTGNQE